MSWDHLMRMLRLRGGPDPDSDDHDPDLAKARQEVKDLHAEADTVLSDYAAAEAARTRRGE